MLSGTLANIYLNYVEREFIINKRNPHEKKIIYWFRYVDDILILFNGTKRQLDMLHQYINNIHINLKFTLEIEKEKSINFLDLTIQNINHKHNFKIYRKETQTDHTIHNTSSHPFQHKISAFNHMLNRLNNIPMSDINYTEELLTIKHIAQVNGYNKTLIDKLNQKIKYKIHHRYLTTLNTNDDSAKKYISTIYDHRTSYIMSKLFKKYGYNIAHKTNKKLGQKLRQNNEETESGIYKLTCNECDNFYIGQTGRAFNLRFKEHIQQLNNATIQTTFKSNYAQHLYNEKHTYTDIQTNLQIIKRMNKGDMMDRIEEIEIYRERNNPRILNDKINTRTNKIYDVILHSKM